MFYFEFFLMNICEDKSNKVARKGLHFPIYSKSMPIYFWIFLGLFVIKWVKSLRNGILLTKGLLSSNNGKCFFRTDFNNQKFLAFCLLGRRGYSVNLSDLKDHSILSGHIIKLKSFLANSLNSIGTLQRIRFNIALSCNTSLILFFELVA